MAHDEKLIRDLEKKANLVRKNCFDIFESTQMGHGGGTMSIIELITALYFHHMKFDPRNTDWPEREQRPLPRGVHPQDASVGVRAPHERRVQHPRQNEVAHVPTAPGEQARVLFAEVPVADELHRGPPSARRVAAASSAASTMFWYPVQRQRLPDSVSRMSDSVGEGCSRR